MGARNNLKRNMNSAEKIKLLFWCFSLQYLIDLCYTLQIWNGKNVMLLRRRVCHKTFSNYRSTNFTGRLCAKKESWSRFSNVLYLYCIFEGMHLLDINMFNIMCAKLKLVGWMLCNQSVAAVIKWFKESDRYEQEFLDPVIDNK